MPWIQLLMAVIAYTTAKKNGASSTNAALIGVGAGLVTNAVVENTKWGQANLQPLNDAVDGWFGIGQGTVSADGEVTDSEGKVIRGPAGTAPVQNADGSVVWVPKESFGKSIVSAGSDVLQSWGGVGTAAVIGTATVTSNLKDYFPWILGGVVLYGVVTS